MYVVAIHKCLWKLVQMKDVYDLVKTFLDIAQISIIFTCFYKFNKIQHKVVSKVSRGIKNLPFQWHQINCLFRKLFHVHAATTSIAELKPARVWYSRPNLNRSLCKSRTAKAVASKFHSEKVKISVLDLFKKFNKNVTLWTKHFEKFSKLRWVYVCATELRLITIQVATKISPSVARLC